MGTLLNKIAIGDEVFSIKTKQHSNKIEINIFHNGNENYPVFTKDDYILKDGKSIDELHSKVLTKFIKLHKRNRGNISKISHQLQSFLSSEITKNNNASKNIQNNQHSSDIIFEKCNRFLDKDISGIVIAENDNVMFIDNKSIIFKDKVLQALQLSYKIIKDNRDKIDIILGNLNNIFISFDECNIIIYPINNQRVCMIISKNGSIGNIFKKAEYIISHFKD